MKAWKKNPQHSGLLLILKKFAHGTSRKTLNQKGFCMTIKNVLILGIVLLFGTTAFAQDDHKIEITGNYSYIHANPQNNSVIPTFSLNGGGGAGAFYFSKYIGIEGEFEGYGSYTHNINIPPGPYCNSTSNCTFSAQGNLFTYNIGPIFKYRTSHFEPFVETLFGGAHSNLYGNLYKDCTISGCSVASKSP